jgi:hypothetical protein
MLRCQHLICVGLADRELPFFERGVADQIEPGVIMSHLDMESVSFERFSEVEGLE